MGVPAHLPGGVRECVCGVSHRMHAPGAYSSEPHFAVSRRVRWRESCARPPLGSSGRGARCRPGARAGSVGRSCRFPPRPRRTPRPSDARRPPWRSRDRGPQTPGHHTVRGRRLESHQSPLPIARKDCRGFHHPLCVIAERGVEHRCLSDGPVQKVGHPTLDVSPNGHIDLNGPGGLLGEITRHAGVQSLASDHEQLVDAEHGACSTAACSNCLRFTTVFLPSRPPRTPGIPLHALRWKAPLRTGSHAGAPGPRATDRSGPREAR